MDTGELTVLFLATETIRGGGRGGQGLGRADGGLGADEVSTNAGLFRTAANTLKLETRREKKI